MPLVHVNTNLPDKDVPKDFEIKLTHKVGEVLNKPLEKITVIVHTGVRQMCGGSSEPMVAADMYSLKVFDEERNPGYTKQFLPFIAEILNLPLNRVALLYHDIQPSDLGRAQ